MDWFQVVAAIWAMFKIALSIFLLGKFVNAWVNDKDLLDTIGYGVLFLGLQRG